MRKRLVYRVLGLALLVIVPQLVMGAPVRRSLYNHSQPQRTYYQSSQMVRTPTPTYHQYVYPQQNEARFGSIHRDRSTTSRVAASMKPSTAAVLPQTYLARASRVEFFPTTATPVLAQAHHSVASSASNPIAQSATEIRAGSAIAEVNALRARRGLSPLIEDASLSAVAHQKASIQAQRGAMGHPSGSMGGARYEGVGMGNQFIACYLYSNVGKYAGAATVVGANGQRYHCLLIR